MFDANSYHAYVIHDYYCSTIVRLHNPGIYGIYNPKALAWAVEPRSATKGLTVCKFRKFSADFSSLTIAMVNYFRLNIS